MATSDDTHDVPALPQRNPAWRTETVLAIARGIRLDDAFDRYPILADALEEAGCNDFDLLAMLRTEGSDCDNELNWLLEGDLGIDALFAARLEQSLLEPQHSAQFVRDYARKHKPTDLKTIFLICVLGAATNLVSYLCRPQEPRIETPKLSGSNMKLQNANKMKSVVNGKFDNQIHDKQGKQVSPMLDSPVEK